MSHSNKENMKKDDSFIIIPRSILESNIWKSRDKFSKIEAFVYLTENARIQNSIASINGIKCGYGQLVKSYNELLKAWNLSNRSEVKRYLDFYINQGWITIIKHKTSSLITISHLLKCNKSATSNVTPNVTNNHTDLKGVTTSRVTTNATPNVTQTLHQEPPSHAQVILNLFDDSDNNITNKEEEKDIYAKFEQFRLKYKSYGGIVRGFQTELDAFKKKHKDWKAVIPMLEYCIDKENEARMKANSQKIFFAKIQNLKTYLYQRSWERYSDGWESYNPNAYHPQGLEYDDDFDAYRFYGGDPTYDLFDGYTNENRPDGARVVQQIFVYQWSALTRTWIKQ